MEFKPIIRQGNRTTEPVDGVDGEDGVAPDVGVSVLQTGPYGRHQWLQELRLLQLTQEAQCGAADELIWVLEVLDDNKLTAQHLLSTWNAT